MSAPVQYAGKFFRSIYQNDSNGYCVFLYRDKKGNTTTVVGSNLPQTKYEVTFVGQWVESAKYGSQFSAQTVLNPLPSDRSDIVDYLASLRVGIGKKRGQQMVRLVGPDQFWNVLDSEPERFYTIAGIHSGVIDKLKKATSDMRLKTELVKLFGPHLKMTDRQFNTLRQTFNGQLDILPDLIRENPYSISKAGWTFEECDNYAQSLPGFDPCSANRISCALTQVVKDAEQSAHTCCPMDMAATGLQKYLNRTQLIYSWDECRNLAASPDPTGDVLVSQGMLYRTVSFEQECVIASKLAQCRRGNHMSGIDWSKLNGAIMHYEQTSGITLAPEQREAVRNVFCQGVCVITGGPGTGKSTILSAILQVWRKVNQNEDWILLAPTGRAARRMSETTGQPAWTIHSAARLRVDEGLDGITPANPGEVLDHQLIIIDETSMVDQSVMAGLLTSLTHPQPTIVLVGDTDQLPSVGAGNVFSDIIRSGQVHVTRLTTIFRQAAQNPIVMNAAKIRDGMTDLLWSNNAFRRIMYQTEEENVEVACRLYCTYARHYGIQNIVLLTPYRDARRKKNICNADSMNRRIQNLYNPLTGQNYMEAGRTLDGEKLTFRVGDRVMQIRNTDTVKNGDIGTVEKIHTNDDDERVLTVLFEAGDRIEYTKDMLIQLDLAYGATRSLVKS